MTESPGTTPAAPALVAAARQQQGTRLPVWFMRQAGRSLPEYRDLRVGTKMLDACSDPGMIHEITMQPVRRHRVDAAIFFSDIVLPLKAMGVDLDIVAGTGPVVAQPVRSRKDLDQLVGLDPQQVDFVTQAITSLVRELGTTPLIGFAGAPFTLASYLVEGGPSKDHALTKSMMAGDPELWDELCRRLAQVSRTFLQVQVDAGAQAVQLFDSWAGALAESDYRARVLPYSREVLQGLQRNVPRIHFGVGTAELLGAMSEAGSEVVGVDWRTPLDVASRRIGGHKAVQGNLDPALLLAPWEVLSERVREVIRRGAQAPGHIFNLGHGVPPSTDPDVLTRIVDLIHTEGPALRAEAGCTD